MKNLLFNMYKIWFIQVTKRSKDKPDWLDRFAASGSVFLFLFSGGMNIYLLCLILLRAPGKTPHKPLMWLSLLLAMWLVDLLLFKVLQLKDLDYNLPENKPDQKTIRKTWRIFFITGIITVILLFIHGYVKR